MTIRTVLLNCGNHADDTINVVGARVAGTPIKRGEFIDLEPGAEYTFSEVHHGGDETCRRHAPAAIMSEGPGAGLVGVTFSRPNSETVNRIKTLAAALINEIEAAEGDGRHKSLAKTAIEEGAMWGVKAATSA